MSQALPTYSGKDVNFTLNSPVTGAIQAGGLNETGLRQLVVRMLVDRTTMETGMDGSVAMSNVPGDMGEIEIQIWQTSPLQQLFIAWADALLAAAAQGDVSNWATSTITIQSILDGSKHQCIGVALNKIPDKTYASQAQSVTWVLKAASIANT